MGQGEKEREERGRQHVWFICRGNVSESEGEELAGEGEVTLSEDLPGRGNIKSEQSAIRLSEVRGVASDWKKEVVIRINKPSSRLTFTIG